MCGAMIKPILIIQTGNSPEDIRPTFGDFSFWFTQALAVTATEVHTIYAHQGEKLPCPSKYCATVISGSHAMVTDHAPWSENAAGWIRHAMDKDAALFGICYGHQLMAYALGGEVDYHPKGREMGTCDITTFSDKVANDPFFSQCPGTFPAQLTHKQTVITAPKNAIVLAQSQHDQHQIVRYGPHAVSTQFHPEFTTTLMSAYVKRCIPQLLEEGFNVEALLSNIRETPQAHHLLKDFITRHRTFSVL
jgi:GMP synthase (glutamine-hydrolysing)